MNDIEYISRKQWFSYARRIEKRNLKETGRSLTYTGIQQRARSFVVSIQIDTDTMIVKKGWRDAMKAQTD
jgi:hypothetical protein